MSSIQPVMDNFTGKSSARTIKLRTEAEEQAVKAKEDQRKAAFAAQVANSNSQPKGMDIKPSPTKGFNKMPGISSEPQGKPDVFKLDQSELEQPQPQMATNEQQSATQPSQAIQQPQEVQNPQETKKPGFFSKLFGKT